jgi:hypothetical protein
MKDLWYSVISGHWVNSGGLGQALRNPRISRSLVTKSAVLLAGIKRETMTTPKRHHFVPLMLLNRFTDADGRIAFFDKSRPNDGVQVTTPKNLIVRQHLYSKKNKDGSRDGTLEAYYSELESEAHVVFNKIIGAVRQRRIPDINSGEKTTWNRFLYEQWRRVPDFHDDIMPLSAFALAVQEGIQEYEAKYRPVTEQERVRFAGDDALRAYRHNARVNALSRRSPDVMEAISDKALYFGITPSQRSFIIGSNPVVKIVPQGMSPELNNPAVEIWLPIHPNVMVASAGTAGTNSLVALHMDRIRGYNESVAKKSTIFGGRSRELVASLARKYS